MNEAFVYHNMILAAGGKEASAQKKNWALALHNRDGACDAMAQEMKLQVKVF